MTDSEKIRELQAENERLLNCVEKNFTFETTAGNKYSIFNTIRKEFAEKLKKRSYCDNVFMDGKWHRYVFVDEIDELLKEYENESSSLLVAEIEVPQSKYVVICNNVKRIFYKDGSYKEINHYSVIHTVPNNVAIYYGEFDTEETADERCAKLNKEWEKYFEEQK